MFPSASTLAETTNSSQLKHNNSYSMHVVWPWVA